MFWTHARIHRYVADGLREQFVGHCGKFRPGEHSPVKRDSEFSRNDCRSLRMITSNHDRPDASRSRVRDGELRFIARGIYHADETQERQIVLEIFAGVGAGHCARQKSACAHGNGAKRLACECIVRSTDFGAPHVAQHNDRLSNEFVRTKAEQDVRSAFRKNGELGARVGAPMNRCHQFPFR